MEFKNNNSFFNINTKEDLEKAKEEVFSDPFEYCDSNIEIEEITYIG